MAYVVFLKSKEGDLSLESFQKLFKDRENFRVEGHQAFYENHNTGVGFYFEYIHTSNQGDENVRPEGTYRIVLSVEYCQPTFFFVEAIYEIEDFIDKGDLVVYDPQIGGKEGAEPFDHDVMFESWKDCNEDAICEYMLGLGPAMDDVFVMPYNTVKLLWEWNYYIPKAREQIANHIHIPSVMAVDYNGDDQTGVVWQQGAPIAIPEVDIVIIAKPDKENPDSGVLDCCALKYDEIRHLVDKYSEGNMGSAKLMSYEHVPEEIQNFFANVNSAAEFAVMDMCDILEYEVAEHALFLNKEESGEPDGDKG